MDDKNNKRVAKQFQFHIVRLKGRMLRHHIRQVLVSIPYSSIKRRLILRVLFCLLRFQFHIVRLKARGMDLLNMCTGFQFHIVRLKVG